MFEIYVKFFRQQQPCCVPSTTNVNAISVAGDWKRLLIRRVASDVEDDDHEVTKEGEGVYDDEDDEGAPPDEDEDQEEEEDEEEEYADSDDAARTRDASEEDDNGEEKFSQQRRITDHVAGEALGATELSKGSANKEGLEEDKQNAEPFVVPTIGAFYMHDDRFRNNGAIRARCELYAM
ncbi:hypothetical protein GOP47_0000722 [Adiantum capillus-veneris]|uniref:Btz domain-containing protein n=1 Tax=Adiantum capillus-veneris TaxID=13818 RepID=A0A9D4VE26_ADICA|nr:hypothetical protein GOP47_0000722 [Adiantum capillus-veneris]